MRIFLWRAEYALMNDVMCLASVKRAASMSFVSVRISWWCFIPFPKKKSFFSFCSHFQTPAGSPILSRAKRSFLFPHLYYLLMLDFIPVTINAKWYKQLDAGAHLHWNLSCLCLTRAEIQGLEINGIEPDGVFLHFWVLCFHFCLVGSECLNSWSALPLLKGFPWCCTCLNVSVPMTCFKTA